MLNKTLGHFQGKIDVIFVEICSGSFLIANYLLKKKKKEATSGGRSCCWLDKHFEKS